MRNGILYIPLSYNADSMKNIINIVFCDEYCLEKNIPMVNKISFLSTMEFDSLISYENEKITANEFCQRVGQELGSDCIEIRHRIVQSYAKDIPIAIMDGLREVGKGNIIIDLTCGKKDITGSLYTTASICQIQNMIYVDVPRVDGVFPKLDRNDYEYMKDKFILTRYESLSEIENLATLNEMDFIFYKKNLQEIRQSNDCEKIESFCALIGHVVEQYFSGNKENYKNAIREIGLINEEIIKAVSWELYQKYKDLDIKPYNPDKSLETIRALEAIYQSKNTREEIIKKLDEVFAKMPVIFELFEIMRVYRNRVSHNRQYYYSKEEVKLLIDMLILVIQKLIEIGLAEKIWKDEISG